MDVVGQQCIAGQPQQCRHLIELLSCNPQLAGILAPHFTPSTSRPTTATSQALVDCYRSIAGLSKKESDLTLVLLTKFDLGWWLRCGQSLAGHRAELLEVIAAALDKHGLTPQPRWLAVHEVLRRHWFQILSHDFGGQYGRVLGLVIASSASHSCSLALWCDLINTLGQGLLRYRPDTSVHEFRQQVLHYTTQQTLLDLHQVTNSSDFSVAWSLVTDHHRQVLSPRTKELRIDSIFDDAVDGDDEATVSAFLEGAAAARPLR